MVALGFFLIIHIPHKVSNLFVITFYKEVSAKDGGIHS